MIFKGGVWGSEVDGLEDAHTLKHTGGTSEGRAWRPRSESTAVGGRGRPPDTGGPCAGSVHAGSAGPRWRDVSGDSDVVIQALAHPRTWVSVFGWARGRPRMRACEYVCESRHVRGAPAVVDVPVAGWRVRGRACKFTRVGRVRGVRILHTRAQADSGNCVLLMPRACVCVSAARVQAVCVAHVCTCLCPRGGCVAQYLVTRVPGACVYLPVRMTEAFCAPGAVATRPGLTDLGDPPPAGAVPSLE